MWLLTAQMVLVVESVPKLTCECELEPAEQRTNYVGIASLPSWQSACGLLNLEAMYADTSEAAHSAPHRRVSRSFAHLSRARTGAATCR